MNTTTTQETAPSPAPYDLRQLHGRAAVITGGSRGIGRAIAEALLGAGASVVISGKSKEKGEQALGEINAGDRVAFVQCDVRMQADLENLIDEATHRYGRLDLLC